MDPAARGARLTVKQWTSYGDDRLYVALPGGELVGWVDLKSGATTLHRPELAAEFAIALDEWRRATSEDTAGGPSTLA